jgi:hypothetical protein
MKKKKTSRKDLLEMIADLNSKFSTAVKRVRELESAMDSGQLVGRPEGIILLAAKVAHEVNRAYCESMGDDSHVPWAEAPDDHKGIVIKAVQDIASNPSISVAESHALWCRHRKQDGWVYGNEYDFAKRIDPCIVPYNDLPEERRTVDALFGAAVRVVLGVQR